MIFINTQSLKHLPSPSTGWQRISYSRESLVRNLHSRKIFSRTEGQSFRRPIWPSFSYNHVCPTLLGRWMQLKCIVILQLSLRLLRGVSLLASQCLECTWGPGYSKQSRVGGQQHTKILGLSVHKYTNTNTQIHKYYVNNTLLCYWDLSITQSLINLPAPSTARRRISESRESFVRN